MNTTRQVLHSRTAQINSNRNAEVVIGAYPEVIVMIVMSGGSFHGTLPANLLLVTSDTLLEPAKYTDYILPYSYGSVHWQLG
jgi:hypothetical protein